LPAAGGAFQLKTRSKEKKGHRRTETSGILTCCKPIRTDEKGGKSQSANERDNRGRKMGALLERIRTASFSERPCRKGLRKREW